MSKTANKLIFFILINYKACSGGPDETRTRDLRRDRAAF